MGKSQVNMGSEPPIFSQDLQVIVFDCDGVLFDSKEANVRFYSAILDHIGHAPVLQPDQEDYIHMYPVQESLRYLLPVRDDYERAWSYCRNMDFRIFHTYLRREPGLIEVLELAKSSYRVAMATNRTVSTHEVLAQFNLAQYFDLVVSALDVKFPKPHPESMERILDTFKVTPGQILYVGDSAVDEGLAMATGVYFAAYKNPKLQAHLYLSHFDELRAILACELQNHRAGPSFES